LTPDDQDIHTPLLSRSAQGPASSPSRPSAASGTIGQSPLVGSPLRSIRAGQPSSPGRQTIGSPVRKPNRPRARLGGRTYALQNIKLTVKPGELVGVIGPVGSGKTALLLALLGEMDVMPPPSVRQSSPLTHLSIRGRIAYVSQEPWIPTGMAHHHCSCTVDV